MLRLTLYCVVFILEIEDMNFYNISVNNAHRDILSHIIRVKVI